jgi:hypothetical protein
LLQCVLIEAIMMTNSLEQWACALLRQAEAEMRVIGWELRSADAPPAALLAQANDLREVADDLFASVREAMRGAASPARAEASRV